MAFQRSSRSLAAAAAAAACAFGTGAPAASAAVQVLPLAAEAPDSALATSSTTAPTCTTPAPMVRYAWLHCHTPAQVRAAYGVDAVAQRGAGQTIVLVDSYGSPTAAADLQYFHDTFFPNLPNPDFQQIDASGGAAQTYGNTCRGNGQSGPSAAQNWAGEATLDIEWAYAIAPLAKIRLIATAPAETLGVQGFPAIFKAVSDAVDRYDAGTVFSFSLGVSEQTFGGAAAQQTAKFDQVFRKGLAKGDTFFASSGDAGTADVSKQHRGTVTYPMPVVGWPASSPYVTAVGGTQLQDNWTWDPQSDVPFTADGNYNPAYFQATTTGASEPTWNESWLPAATGGGKSAIYPRPSWQAGVAGVVGSSRGVPDLSWNAAVDGGVLVYTSFFPSTVRGDGCNRVGWHLYGGTSASSPQVAALTALANEARRTAGKAPIGFLNPQLYTRPDLGPSTTPGYTGGGAFRDIVPRVYGNPSILSGHLVSNRMFDYNGDGLPVTLDPVPGYPVLPSYDLTNGWGSPRAPQYVSALVAATPVAAP